MDNVNHPSHYNQYDHEVIELSRLLPYCAGNVVKYILRGPFKNGIEDLQKCLWYSMDVLQSPVFDIDDEQFNSLYLPLINYFQAKAAESNIPCAREFSHLFETICYYATRTTHSWEYRERLANDITDMVIIIEKNHEWIAALNEYQSSRR